MTVEGPGSSGAFAFRIQANLNFLGAPSPCGAHIAYPDTHRRIDDIREGSR
jgi:hypothetical protein